MSFRGPQEQEKAGILVVNADDTGSNSKLVDVLSLRTYSAKIRRRPTPS